MRSMKIFQALFVLMIISLSCANTDKANSTKDPSNEIILKVNHFKSPCSGEGQSICYMIKSSGENDWTYLFRDIEGFEFEWGNTYELKATREKNPFSKISEDEFIYKLIEVVSKESIGTTVEFELELDASYFAPLDMESQDYLPLIDETMVTFSSSELYQKTMIAIKSGEYFKGVFIHTEDKNRIKMVKLL